MRSVPDVEMTLERYADTVRRICFVHLKNDADTEDLFQNIFLKYMTYDGDFEDEEHRKAWMIRVAINACKDHLRYRFRHKTAPLEAWNESVSVSPQQREVLCAVLSLPGKYRDVIYLHYYEGYLAAEIGEILRVKENTIYSLLSRGRAMLKKMLGGDGHDETHS